MTTNEKGNIALSQAIAYFVANKYTVSIPLNDTQYYDLVIEKDGKLEMVQVKYVGLSSNGKYTCSLRTISGSSRKEIYSVKDTYSDWLFCYCDNKQKYLIPVNDIKNINSICLTNKRNKFSNKNTFDSSQYYISD